MHGRFAANSTTVYRQQRLLAKKEYAERSRAVCALIVTTPLRPRLKAEPRRLRAMPVTYRDAIKRHIGHYVRRAREYQDLPLMRLELSGDFENILKAARYCTQIEDWPSLRDLTRSLNQSLLKSAQSDLFIELNQSLLQSGFLSVDETLGVWSELASIEDKKGNYDAADGWYKQIILFGYAHGRGIFIVLNALRQRSRISRGKGVLDLCVKYLALGLRIASENHLSSEEADLLFELAVVHRERSSLDLALDACRDGLELAVSICYYTRIIEILVLQGDLHWLEHRVRESRDSYEAALIRATDREDHGNAVAIRERLRKVAHAMKRGIFVSYNHDDRAFAERLATDLRASGLAVWWAEWEIKVGDSIVQKVSDGILESGYLAVALSPSSVTSDWVQREVSSALMQQLSAEREIKILPLLLADCEIPILLRPIKWADFRQDYGVGLKDLLNVLIPTD